MARRPKIQTLNWAVSCHHLAFGGKARNASLSHLLPAVTVHIFSALTDNSYLTVFLSCWTRLHSSGFKFPPDQRFPVKAVCVWGKWRLQPLHRRRPWTKTVEIRCQTLFTDPNINLEWRLSRLRAAIQQRRCWINRLPTAPRRRWRLIKRRRFAAMLTAKPRKQKLTSSSCSVATSHVLFRLHFASRANWCDATGTLAGRGRAGKSESDCFYIVLSRLRTDYGCGEMLLGETGSRTSASL